MRISIRRRRIGNRAVSYLGQEGQMWRKKITNFCPENKFSIITNLLRALLVLQRIVAQTTYGANPRRKPIGRVHLGIHGQK